MNTIEKNSEIGDRFVSFQFNKRRVIKSRVDERGDVVLIVGGENFFCAWWLITQEKGFFIERILVKGKVGNESIYIQQLLLL